MHKELARLKIVRKDPHNFASWILHRELCELFGVQQSRGAAGLAGSQEEGKRVRNGFPATFGAINLSMTSDKRDDLTTPV